MGTMISREVRSRSRSTTKHKGLELQSNTVSIAKNRFFSKSGRTALEKRGIVSEAVETALYTSKHDKHPFLRIVESNAGNIDHLVFTVDKSSDLLSLLGESNWRIELSRFGKLRISPIKEQLFRNATILKKQDIKRFITTIVSSLTENNFLEIYEIEIKKLQLLAEKRKKRKKFRKNITKLIKNISFAGAATFAGFLTHDPGATKQFIRAAMLGIGPTGEVAYDALDLTEEYIQGNGHGPGNFIPFLVAGDPNAYDRYIAQRNYVLWATEDIGNKLESTLTYTDTFDYATLTRNIVGEGVASRWRENITTEQTSPVENSTANLYELIPPEWNLSLEEKNLLIRAFLDDPEKYYINSDQEQWLLSNNYSVNNYHFSTNQVGFADFLEIVANTRESLGAETTFLEVLDFATALKSDEILHRIDRQGFPHGTIVYRPIEGSDEWESEIVHHYTDSIDEILTSIRKYNLSPDEFSLLQRLRFWHLKYELTWEGYEKYLAALSETGLISLELSKANRFESLQVIEYLSQEFVLSVDYSSLSSSGLYMHDGQPTDFLGYQIVLNDYYVSGDYNTVSLLTSMQGVIDALGSNSSDLNVSVQYWQQVAELIRTSVPRFFNSYQELSESDIDFAYNPLLAETGAELGRIMPIQLESVHFDRYPSEGIYDNDSKESQIVPVYAPLGVPINPIFTLDENGELKDVNDSLRGSETIIQNSLDRNLWIITANGTNLVPLKELGTNSEEIISTVETLYPEATAAFVPSVLVYHTDIERLKLDAENSGGYVNNLTAWTALLVVTEDGALNLVQFDRFYIETDADVDAFFTQLESTLGSRILEITNTDPGSGALFSQPTINNGYYTYGLEQSLRVPGADIVSNPGIHAFNFQIEP